MMIGNLHVYPYRTMEQMYEKQGGSKMITYPFLEKGATIGVTAPSSGVRAGLHDLLKLASSRMEERGYTVTCGETAWTQEKAKSAPARIRAKELRI